MARRSKVTYWPSRGGYGCVIRGDQFILARGPKDEPTGPTYLRALEVFRQRLSLSQAGTAGDTNTLRVICDRYLVHMKTKRKATTIDTKARMLRPFVDQHGDLPVSKLTPLIVEEFVAAMRKPRRVEAARKVCGWTDGGVRTFLISLSTALNWAVKVGMIGRNPISGKIECPRARRRRDEVVLNDEDYRRILAASHPEARDFIVVLKMTGCRPGELVAATAADFDPSIEAIVYKSDDRRREDEFSHKTAYTGRDRTIYLDGEALAILRRLIVERPEGQLFRATNGGPLTGDAIEQRFKALRKLLKIPGLTAYSARHTFATRWLEQGKPIEALAALLGNSPATILKHYSHLSAQHATLRKYLAEFIDDEAERTETAPRMPRIADCGG